MKKLLLAALFLTAATSGFAQEYIKAAPEGGFDIKNGKDYIVLYAHSELIKNIGMSGLMTTNNNLDKTQKDNYLEYWVTDWDKKALTLYNVPEGDDMRNSFGYPEYINATPLFAWGTGVFMAKAKPYDLSKVTDNHHIHIGLRDFGTAPSKYQFSIGSQKTITTNGFQIEVGIDKGAADGNFAGVGKIAGGNDGKWYYLDIPVRDLVDENGDFGFTYDFSQPIADGVFTFSFRDPVCSTETHTGPAPGETVYSYEITSLGSALSIDHVFFYIPTESGVEAVISPEDDAVEAVYDLYGRRVENPSNGIFIVKTAKGTSKVRF